MVNHLVLEGLVNFTVPVEGGFPELAGGLMLATLPPTASAAVLAVDGGGGLSAEAGLLDKVAGLLAKLLTKVAGWLAEMAARLLPEMAAGLLTEMTGLLLAEAGKLLTATITGLLGEGAVLIG